MILAPKGGKLLFTGLVHRTTPEKFEAKRQQRLERDYTTPEGQVRYRESFNASHPGKHRYNDIAGFLELYWDGGTRLLVDSYFRGERNRKYGKAVSMNREGRVRADSFYLHSFRYEVGRFISSESTASAVKLAIVQALDQIERFAREYGCFADTKNERIMAQVVDFSKLLKP